jgi:nitrogen fixation protein NifU and related proteins
MTQQSALDDLYRDLIVAHARAPHNYGTLIRASLSAEGANLSCGDEVTVELRIDDGAVQAAGFTGEGCAISRASASLMTDAVIGRSVTDALLLIAAFAAMLRGDEAHGELGDLEALCGVARFPSRVKCALLPWNTLKQALQASMLATSV